MGGQDGVEVQSQPALFTPRSVPQVPGVTREGVNSSVPLSRVSLSPTIPQLLIFKRPDD